MCGWVGVFGQSVDTGDIEAAADLLASRGPDDTGVRALETDAIRGAVGHRRLAILDPSPAGAQPMHDAASGVTVVYNGEIYNSPQLRRELASSGVAFRSQSDTEVLLHGWAHWGDAVLDRIEGIFSFALINEREGRVLLARDRIGIKPLYWAELGGTLLAASAPRSILHLCPHIRADIDRIAIAQFLTLLWIPHPRTPWRAVRKLEPGHALSFADGRLRQWCYWAAAEDCGTPLSSDQLRAAIETATARQLLSDVPVGLLLSGGLDSTLLLEFMVRHYDGFEALTAGYDPSSQRLELAPDDSRYAALAVKRYPQVRLTPAEVDGEAEADLARLTLHFDDPVADPAAISMYRLARRSNSKVLLSGVGGEELFGGYPRHHGLGLARRAAAMPLLARRFAGRASASLSGGRPGILYQARRNGQKLARAISDVRTPHYWRMMSQLTFAELEALVPETATDVYDELDAQSTPLVETSLSEALAFDRSQFLPNLNLAYIDKASMAASVEVRVPLLDEFVIDLAVRATATSFIQAGITKAPLRHAARGLVPDAIIERPKSGFGGPARAWFRGSRAPLLRDRIEAVAQSGLVDERAADTIFRSAASGRQDLALAAWALVCLQAWHEQHVSPLTALTTGGR
jgi:asparagine synthase (glutamine-hydrolysing)